MSKRISALTELAETPATGDLFVIADISASTEDKKITWSTIRTGIATYLASLSQTLTGKTIDLTDNTLTGTTAEFNTALSDGDFATLAGTETLTNKTLTSPVINTPTGIVKGDVGLGNVDNTSDASKPVSTATQTALDLKANDADVVHDTGAETIDGVKTFSSDPLIPDEAYGAGWNGSLEPPTKNAVYDKIETMGSGGASDLTFIPAAAGALVGTGSSFKAGSAIDQSPVASFADAQTNTLYLSTIVPDGKTAISSVKLVMAGDGIGNNVYLFFGFNSIPAAGGAAQTDSEAAAAYAITANTQAQLLTVPSTGYNGLTIAEGRYIGMNIQRQGGNANDTHSTSWEVLGVLITWS